ncbi:hypothetical protein ACWGF3_32965 [Streptomyces xanthophaeus]
MIDAHVRGALKKAFNEAASEPGPLLNLSARGSVWAGTGLGFHPWFTVGASGNLQCPQEKVLGILAIRNAIRSAFLCARSIMAGDLLIEQGFRAASAAMFYTGAFHGLDGFLATRGRVMIQPARGKARYHSTESSELLQHESLPGDPHVICAIMARTGKWSFESRKRNHVNRWGELKQLITSSSSTLPDPIVTALAYSAHRNPKEDLQELMNSGVPALAALRHQALYEGFGYDDDAYDAFTNRENPYGFGLNKRADVLRDLAVELLASSLTVAEFYFDWCDKHRGDHNSVTQRIAIACSIPAFEFSVPEEGSEVPHNTRVRHLAARVDAAFS